MFKVKFRIKGKLLALVLGVSALFIIIVLLLNNLIVTVILAVLMFFFLRIAKSYAVAKEEFTKILPKKVYLDAKFDNIWERIPWSVTDEADGQTYEAELLDQTCTCREYQDFHNFYPIGDLRRICRHQVKGYVDSGRLSNLNEITQFMISEAYKKNEGATFREIWASSGIGANLSLFYYDEDTNVVGLVYKDGADGVYEEFRFNRNDQTWENDFKPAYTDYMVQAMEGWRFTVERAKEKAAAKNAVKALPEN